MSEVSKKHKKDPPFQHSFNLRFLFLLLSQGRRLYAKLKNRIKGGGEEGMEAKEEEIESRFLFNTLSIRSASICRELHKVTAQ